MGEERIKQAKIHKRKNQQSERDKEEIFKQGFSQVMNTGRMSLRADNGRDGDKRIDGAQM